MSLEHWEQDHPSHISDCEHDDKVKLLTPSKPLVCRACGWPGTFTGICDTCIFLLTLDQELLEREAAKKRKARGGK